jgi:hypothetical protein
MKKLIPLLILLSGFISKPAISQIDTANIGYLLADTQNLSIGLFDNDDPIEISLKFDITYYKKHKSDVEYLPAVLTYCTNEKDTISKNVEVKSRGESRRRICNFPPLKLNLKLTDSVGDEFAGIETLKLVPYCKIGYEEYVLKEYLVYKLYNVLTENSFRVRLLSVNYINTSKKDKSIKQYGFAIEPVKLLEKRINSYEIELPNISQTNIKPDVMNRVAIFNYMVGNTDWSVPNRHNALVLSQPLSDQPELGLLVPFDFDYSGLVNAEYAATSDALPITSVRQRYYVGICRDEEDLMESLKEFTEKKEMFYKVINDFPYLNDRSKKDIIGYLDEFYNSFDRRNSIVRYILDSCQKLQ